VYYFESLITYGLSLGITLLMSWALIPVARHIGLVDRPDARKRHAGDMPLVGGMAMFCGFSFAVLAGGISVGPERALLAGAMLLVIAGVLDDFRELSALSRFVAQIISSLLMIYWGHTVLRDLGHLWPSGALFELGWLAAPITVFAVVGGINALNMADGLDGLAGGLALIALLPLTYLAWEAGASHLLPFIGITAACVLGFWILNMRFPWQSRARLFMGDGGSMFVGFLITWFLADLSQEPHRAIAPVTALYLFAIPLLDTVFVMVRRVRGGRSPLSADRLHLHHLLLDMGLTPGRAVVSILAMGVVLAGLGLAGRYASVPENLMFGGFLAIFAAYYWACTSLRREAGEWQGSHRQNG